MRVALLESPAGPEVDGYAAVLCGPMRGNRTAERVSWSSGGTQRLPAGAAVAGMALRFELEGEVQLFSFLLE